MDDPSSQNNPPDYIPPGPSSVDEELLKSTDLSDRPESQAPNANPTPPRGHPEPLVYEETPILTPISEPPVPVPPKKVESKSNFLTRLGKLIFIVALFAAGFGLSVLLKRYLLSGLPSVPASTAPSPSTISRITPEPPVAVSSPILIQDPFATWKSYQVLSGITKKPVEGVSYKLPPQVLAPLCDGSGCASQGTYLPGGTRFTVATRGIGQVLPDFRGKIVSDLVGKEFDVKEATIAGHPGVEFMARFTGSTSGGYSFAQMRGFMIQLDDQISLEINHFTPTGVNADFLSDDTLFDQVLANFSFTFPPINSQPLLTTTTPSPPVSAEGKVCGGVAADLPLYKCPAGYYCKLTSTYPDATGKCTKEK